MSGGRSKAGATTSASSPASQPHDALAALMEGKAPDKGALLFPSERGEDQESDYISYGRSGSGHSRYPGENGFEYTPAKAENGAHHQGALHSVKNGATKSGAFVKDKTVAGATYLKEKDWKKEKELAGKAGAATKTGAIYVGNNVAKGAGWLWKSGKSGVDNLRGKPEPK